MKNNKLIGIIGAMDIEVKTLKEAIVNCNCISVGDMDFFQGEINEKSVIVVKCGIGKVNAARCAQTLCDRFGVDLIINTGIAGGIGDGLAVSDLVIGEELVQHDFDVTGFGYKKGYMFMGDKDKETVYYSDPGIVELLEKAASINLSTEKIKKGRIATGDVFVSSAKIKQEIKDEFNALVTEMEGGAIAQTATANKVPFAVVRAVSDLADGTAASCYEEFEKQTAFLCAKIIKSFLELV